MKRIGSLSKAALGLLAGLVAGLGLGAPALADNDVGCGVGTMIMEGKQGLLPHLAASCTNGMTFQSISITFGFLGCDATGKVTADAELRKFAAANIDRIARDVARGEGEALEVVAHLLQVGETTRPAFYAYTQAHFETLFPDEGTTSNEMLDSLYRLLGSEPAAS